MIRRKDGRELFEVFKETMTRPAQPGPRARPAPAGTPRPEAAGDDELVHVFRLGDRRTVEISLSISWVNGLIFFLLLLLAGVFVIGRRFAPIPEPEKQVQAPDQFVQEAQRVGDVQVNAPAMLPPQPQPQPAFAPPAPAPTPQYVPPVTGQGNVTLCFITYPGESRRGMADETVKYLRDQGFSDARVLKEKATGKLIVAVGAFASREAPEAGDTTVRLSPITFRGQSGKLAYFVDLKKYQ